MDVAALEDLFAPVGPVAVRRMFGGFGIYTDGLMIALFSGGEVFIKVDAPTEPAFREAGSQPFTYGTAKRRTVMSYWRLPDAAFDDPDAMARWARLGVEAARRAAARKTARSRQRRAALP